MPPDPHDATPRPLAVPTRDPRAQRSTAAPPWRHHGPAGRRSGRSPLAVVTLLALIGAAFLALFAWGGAGPPPPAAGGASPRSDAGVALDPEGASPPSCGVDARPAPLASYERHADTPLDPQYALPADYIPPDLVPLTAAGFDDARTVRALLIPDLRALREAAAAAGSPIEIQSAYRSYAYQERVFDGWVAQLGRERALQVSARPGHSEHQLGTAIDVRSAGGPAPWDLPDWADTPAGGWMAAHAWRYGFVMSYPEGSEEVTCYDYEPWHYRWIGRNGAREVRESDVPLRVWLWRAGGPLEPFRDPAAGSDDAR